MKKIDRLNVDYFVEKIRHPDTSDWHRMRAALMLIKLVYKHQTGEIRMFIEHIRAGQSLEAAAGLTIGVHEAVVAPVIPEVQTDLSNAYWSMVNSDNWYDEDRENKL